MRVDLAVRAFQIGMRDDPRRRRRELGRLCAETARVALLHEAARTFAGLGARGEAEATEREAGLLAEVPTH